MTIKHLIVTGALTLVAFVTLQPGTARADDYCREYTRTVYVGGRPQEAYGTACLQPDGSWMIVGEGLGANNAAYSNSSNVTYVIHDDRSDIVPTRVVYYERPIETYRYRPTPLFVWYSSDHRHGYKNRFDSRRYDRWDDDDRDYQRGHQRGYR